MNGSFAMRLGTVLKNAEPNSSATQCVFVTSSGKAAVSLETALNSIVHFSEAGKPIQEGGPCIFTLKTRFITNSRLPM